MIIQFGRNIRGLRSNILPKAMSATRWALPGLTGLSFSSVLISVQCTCLQVCDWYHLRCPSDPTPHGFQLLIPEELDLLMSPETSLKVQVVSSGLQSVAHEVQKLRVGNQTDSKQFQRWAGTTGCARRVREGCVWSTMTLHGERELSQHGQWQQ